MEIKTIKASSRASVKIGDSYYTIEYCEERSVNDNDIIDEERSALWNTVNTECDNQIADIIKTFKK